MKVENYASELAMKTFTALSAMDIEEQVNAWMKAKPNVWVSSMELTSSHDPVNNRLEFTVILAYQPSEQAES